MRGISGNSALARCQLKGKTIQRGFGTPRSVPKRMAMNTNIAPASPLNHCAAKQLKINAWKEKSMDILIRADGVELTDKLREAVNQKIGRVRQYAPRAVRARVHLHKVRANPSPHQFETRVLYELPAKISARNRRPMIRSARLMWWRKRLNDACANGRPRDSRAACAIIERESIRVGWCSP